MTKDTYSRIDGFTFFKCNDIPKLPTMDLRFGDYWLEVSVDDIVANFDGIDCAISLIESDRDYAILGNAFLRNFYVVYDQENQRMSFASLISGKFEPKADPAVGTIPDESFHKYDGDYTLEKPKSLTEALLGLYYAFNRLNSH